MAPGSEFAYGDVIEVGAIQNSPGFDDKHYEARINLSIKEVKVAPATDFDSLQDPQKFAGMIPVYVYKDLEIVSGSGAGFTDEQIVVGVDLWAAGDDQPAETLTVFDPSGKSPLCAGNEHLENHSGDHPNVPGKKVTNCEIFLLKEGQTVGSITYRNAAYKDELSKEDDPHKADPIVFPV